jgi:hypothetical protein
MENLQTNSGNEVVASWINTRLGRLAAAAVLVAEVTPINEAMRAAVFVGAQMRFDDPLPVAIAYGLSTLAIEAPAGFVAADIVSTEGAKNITSKVTRKISKIGTPDKPITNRVTETGIGLVGGSAVQMLVKHSQEPGMTKEENRKYAMTSSVGIAAICGAQGYLVSAGISHPSTLTIAGAVLTVGITAGLIPVLRTKLSKQPSSINQTKEDFRYE